MAQKGLSTRLQQMKFMQRGKLKAEALQKKEGEEKRVEDEHWIMESSQSALTSSKCVVILEGDPKPEQILGRFSFKSFNPSIEKLHSEISGIPSENEKGHKKRKSDGVELNEDDDKLRKRQKTDSSNQKEESSTPKDRNFRKPRNQNHSIQTQNRDQDQSQEDKRKYVDSSQSQNKRIKSKYPDSDPIIGSKSDKKYFDKDKNSSNGDVSFQAKQNWRTLRPGGQN